MKQLPLEYRKYGYVFKQVKRECMVAIYEQINKDDGKTVGFEVFEICIQKEGEIFGRKIEEKEIPPSSGEWGVNAFTSANLEAAFVRFEHFKKHISMRKLKVG